MTTSALTLADETDFLQRLYSTNGERLSPLPAALAANGYKKGKSGTWSRYNEKKYLDTFTTREVAAPYDLVWSKVSDVENMPDWNPDTSSVAILETVETDTGPVKAMRTTGVAQLMGIISPRVLYDTMGVYQLSADAAALVMKGMDPPEVAYAGHVPMKKGLCAVVVRRTDDPARCEVDLLNALEDIGGSLTASIANTGSETVIRSWFNSLERACAEK